MQFGKQMLTVAKLCSCGQIMVKWHFRKLFLREAFCDKRNQLICECCLLLWTFSIAGVLIAVSFTMTYLIAPRLREGRSAMQTIQQRVDR